ncbi:MAG: mechanosensitive ion channel domain-containing protein [Flavobacteriales bacterium]
MDLLTALPYRTQLIETAVAIGLFLLVRRVVRSVVRATLLRAVVKEKEEREVLRLLGALLYLVFGVTLAAIWGVDQNEILIFATSVITVLGVAFFAEMSILSNVTACLVLFFQHPVKRGDRIRVFDGEQWVEGELMDITYFFVFIRTDDQGVISVPNATLLKNAFHIVRTV